MPDRGPGWSARLQSWMSAAAVSVLAAVLAAAGRMAVPDAVWLSVSALSAYVPSGWMAAVGWRRRASEALLIPVAAVLVLVADPTVRRMMLPPLLVVAAAAAAWVADSRSQNGPRPLLWVAFALAARAAGGLGFIGAGVVPAGLAVAATVAVGWAASYRGRVVALVAASTVAVVPLQRWPLAAVIVIVAALGLLPWARRPGTTIPGNLSAWIPALAACALLGSALAPWGSLWPGWAFPAMGWLTIAASVVALVVTPRLPATMAGLLWFVIAMSLGPVQGPTPELPLTKVPSSAPEVRLPPGSGGPYVVDLSLRNGRMVADDSPVAVLVTSSGERVLRAGREVAETAHRRPDVAASVRHSLPSSPVWRPAKIGNDAVWQLSGRTVFAVPEGERPTLTRRPDLAAKTMLVVEAAGPVAAIPPRDWTLPKWMWAAAVVVILIQLLSGSWRNAWSILPWAILVTGATAARASVEPLRLVAERQAVDLALAAVLAAWLPAAWRWFDRGHVARAMAFLLVPLALATPHLTPPMYGDEPYHLKIMESVVADGDLDPTNNLSGEDLAGDRGRVANRGLLQSPLLALVLIPGYAVAKRAGALVLLAVVGVMCAVLLARRSADLGIPRSRIRWVMLGLALTYPVATFATQIWVELPGATMLAGILVSAGASFGGGWVAAFAALAAAAMKTRLGLIAFPAAAALWWRTERRWIGVGVLGVAAAAALAVGWLTMGHPFGAFRRVAHLLPTDPGLAARVVGGLAFDPAGGLAFTGPFLLVAIAATALLWKHGRAPERAMLVGGVLTVAALLSSKEWYGGGAPPARYLIPMIPAYALTWGVALWKPVTWRRLAEVLVPPSVFMWWALVTRPHFSINPGDGHWWLTDALARRLSADTQFLVPSFLVPSPATLWVPAAMVILVGAAAIACAKNRQAVRLLVRAEVAIWLTVAVACTALAVHRLDRVVELESAQVRRFGGRPYPPEGTFSRWEHRLGWRVSDGQGVLVPLHLPDNAEVWLEGWLVGRAQLGSTLRVRWDSGDWSALKVAGGATDGRVRLPDPPAAGRHRLRIVLRAPPRGAAVLDRVVITREE